MSIFGFGTPSELTTHIGVMVKSATDSLRISPDWTLNLQICDEIGRNRREYSEQAVRAIKRRLTDNDQQTVFLALILFETCMKNCGGDFASIVDKSVMDDMVKVAQGSKGIKNSEEALRLIATWGRVFEHRRSSFPLFFDTFMHMKSRGITFPKEDDNAVLSYEGFERPNSRHASRDTPSSAMSHTRNDIAQGPAAAPPSSSSFAASNQPPPQQIEDEFLKLQLDLSVVMEKVNLCREILQVSPGIQHDEALADVIGFLEACRDRMVDVIEAGTQGLLGEELFAVALKVNDAVLRTLDAERTGGKIAVGEEEQATGSKAAATENLLDLSPTTPKAAQPAVPARNMEFTDDLFAPAPAAAHANVAPAVVPSSVADFDPFGHASITTTAATPSESNTASSVPTIVQATDPFAPANTPFLPPASTSQVSQVAPVSFLPPPQPPAAAVATTSASTAAAPSSHNPFDDFVAPLPAPAAPVVAAPTGIASSVAAQEFDDFLASLEKKK